MAQDDAPGFINFTLDGTTTTVPFDFFIFEEGDLEVIVTSAITGLSTTLSNGTDYRVYGAGAYTGRSVVLTSAGTDGDNLLIRRKLDYTQPSVFRNQTRPRMSMVEQALDRATMLIQQNRDALEFVPSFPPGYTGTAGKLPLPDPAEARLVGFGVGGAWTSFPTSSAGYWSDLGDPAYGDKLVATTYPGSGVNLTQNDLNLRVMTMEQLGATDGGYADAAFALAQSLSGAVYLSHSPTPAKIKLVGKGTYLVHGDVDLRLVPCDFTAAQIILDSATNIFSVGGSSDTTLTPEMSFGIIRRSPEESATVPTLRVKGMKCGNISVQYCDFMQLYADTNSTSNPAIYDPSTGTTHAINLNGSIAYSKFFLGYVHRLDIDTAPTTDRSSIQWINANDFYISRCKLLNMGGTYSHNHNTIRSGAFEGQEACITLTSASFNYLYNLRFENPAEAWTTGTVYAVGARVRPTSTADALYKCLVAHTSGTFATDLANGKWAVSYLIDMGSATVGNGVHAGWASSYSTILNIPGDTAIGSAYIQDLGTINVVHNDILETYHWETLCSAGIEDEFPNTAVAGQRFYNRSMNIQRVRSVGASTLCQSEIVPAEVGDIFRWRSLDTVGDWDAATCDYFRTRITFFDAGMRPITPSASWITTLTGSFATVSGNSLLSSSDQPHGGVILTSDAASAKFVRCEWIATSTTPTASACIRLIILHGRRKTYYRGFPKSKPSACEGRAIFVSGTPTAATDTTPGVVLYKSDKSATYACAFTLDTTLGAAYTSGTGITVASGTGTANGDLVAMCLDDGTTHTTTIASGGGTTSIVLTAGAPSAAANGSRILFNRFV